MIHNDSTFQTQGGSAITQPTERDKDALRILIVENEATHAERLEEMLSDYRDPITGSKCEVSIATNIDCARSHLVRDTIDIYIVDLRMVAHEHSPLETEDIEIGAKFVGEIATQSNAGVIVCSSIHPEREAPRLLEMGADDYIWKMPPFWQYPPVWEDGIPAILRARVTALWRRIQFTRPKTSQLFAHNDRVFLVGEWRFTVGNRKLRNAVGASIRLSATEHALLRYACVIEDHEVQADRFAEDALQKDKHAQFRLDNLIHQMKNKLGNSVEWQSLGNRAYKLMSVRELKAGTG